MRALILLLGAVACAPTARAPVAATSPVPQLDARTAFRAYLEQRPAHVKMRHRVESTVGERRDVVQGVMLLALPDRFWLRVLGPLGTTLFDVRQDVTGHVVVVKALAQLDDALGPAYLARDIARMYLDDCPPDAALFDDPRGLEARCALGPATDADPATPEADDALREVVAPNGLLLEKRFFSRGHETARVRYENPQSFDGTWLARTIELTPTALPYRLRITLLDADPRFDVAAAFAGATP